MMLVKTEIPLSPAEWQIWKNLPTTQRILDALFAERSLWVERLVFGETLTDGDSIKETAIAVGVCKGLSMILEGVEILLGEQWAEAQERKEESGHQ